MRNSAFVASRSRRSNQRTVSTVSSTATSSQVTRLSTSGSASYWNVAMSVHLVALQRSQLNTQFILPRIWNQPESTIVPSPIAYVA